MILNMEKIFENTHNTIAEAFKGFPFPDPFDHEKFNEIIDNISNIIMSPEDRVKDFLDAIAEYRRFFFKYLPKEEKPWWEQ